MKAYLLITVLASAMCPAVMAQALEAPTTARQLASLFDGSSEEVVAFERYVIKTFADLRDSKVICPPQGRSAEANALAAVEAAKTGIEEGRFEHDGPATAPLTEAFGFWFPCRN